MVGKISTTRNLDPKVNAQTTYYRILVLNEKNEHETLLITESELARVRSRVKKNPEDEATLSLADKIILWAMKLLS